MILLSYGMNSALFDAEAFVDVPVPILVTERNVLPRLKMSSTTGFTAKMTALTFVSDHPLAGGHLNGDVEVYSPAQEFFWGIPGPESIRIAHIVGEPDKVACFACEKGVVMDGAVAPARRVQFFHARHSPDPVDENLYLNATGLELLGGAIDWCLEQPQCGRNMVGRQVIRNPAVRAKAATHPLRAYASGLTRKRLLAAMEGKEQTGWNGHSARSWTAVVLHRFPRGSP